MFLTVDIFTDFADPYGECFYCSFFNIGSFAIDCNIFFQTIAFFLIELQTKGIFNVLYKVMLWQKMEN